jgi:hypothetical protein
MLSFRRLAVTVTAVAALAAPAAAQARPDLAPPAQGTSDAVKVDRVSPDARYGVPTAAKLDRVSPDARYGVPDGTTRFISVPDTQVVQADDGFDWGAALIGGGAALALALVLGGTALTVRPHRATTQH